MRSSAAAKNHRALPHFIPARPPATASRTAGFTLIEVMLAIMVLTLGAIGMAGLQLAALRAAQQSSWQTSATQLAAEMADLIRAASKQQFAASLSYTYDSRSDANPAPPSCYTRPCDTAQWISFHRYEWNQRLRNTLPGARVTICTDTVTHIDHRDWSCHGGPDPVIKLGWRNNTPRKITGNHAGTATQDSDKDSDTPQLVMAIGA
ncbi:type IV pilus modification protein PilV [Herbaspirillum sp. RTI4]|uniref:type IV pilus modification protein PilV n=1 Tax=Herbaspirillum sp. RTI4 TaxID=3048640 RepID=UPI002AB59D4D|nr:type IV pilus modification protein PilV [Herbaspirillum sp. RTI4]MDY7579802.1 type IV pilus modification protein PilV [Herbaspirillum sp. RTI4]MEA9982593.1 type IV pilus modification protein PilV [Herbaspirillum sp. RTI4]